METGSQLFVEGDPHVAVRTDKRFAHIVDDHSRGEQLLLHFTVQFKEQRLLRHVQPFDLSGQNGVHRLPG
ncbi:hypothetical protein D3C81_1930300 [compost metagenome]